MYTKKSRSRPCLALLFLDRVRSSFSIFGIVVLILLSSRSVAQLIPYSRALPNTSLSSNTLKTYVIYSFVEGPSLDSENERIRLHLGMILSSTDAEEYGGDYTGVEFWRVRMNDVQRAAFTSAIPGAQIYEDKQFLYHESQIAEKPSQTMTHPDQSLSQTVNDTYSGLTLGAGTVYQRDASLDLRVVSWAPGALLGKSKSYAYELESGGEAIIYLIENGIDGQNREFVWPPQEWLYAPGVRRTETDDDPYSHGSCVASKATGARNGVSKTTPLVVVKSSPSLVDIAWALQRIVNAVAKQKAGRAVVLLAATTRTPWRSALLQDARFSRLYLRMENLINLGAVVVVPSGSYGERSFVADTVPAVFSSPSKIAGRQPLPLIVAGSVDNRGAEASWSQSTLNSMVWAPGVEVACTKRGWNFRPTESGTSFSAGMVAGLAAYFLGMKTPPFAVGGPDTSRNLMNYFRNSAGWARLPGLRRVIWNQQDGRLGPLSNASIAPLT